MVNHLTKVKEILLCINEVINQSINHNKIMSCSFVTATYMVEAMAAANATLRLRKAVKNLSVSVITMRI